MLVLTGIFVLHVSAIILLLVATIDNAWWVSDRLSTDLWGRWELTNSDWHYFNLKNYPQDYLQSVQGTAVLACVFTILALFVFLAQLFTLPKGQRFTFTGILQLIACLCIMTTASIYTAQFPIDATEGWYGHSYILAWISFVLTLFLTIIYLVLRKNSE